MNTNGTLTQACWIFIFMNWGEVRVYSCSFFYLDGLPHFYISTGIACSVMVFRLESCHEHLEQNQILGRPES